MPSPLSSLNAFKDNFLGGTRQNRFLVLGGFPSGSDTPSNGNATSTDMRFHIRSTLIPTLQTSSLAYDHFGRKLYYPGEKLYSTWSVSVLDDTNSGNLWQKFQNWQNYINKHLDNRTNYVSGANYKMNWTIQHLDLNGNALKQFYINGIWPRTINEISFNSARPNVLNTFNVVFVYDTVEIVGITSTGSGNSQ